MEELLPCEVSFGASVAQQTHIFLLSYKYLSLETEHAVFILAEV